MNAEVLVSQDVPEPAGRQVGRRSVVREAGPLLTSLAVHAGIVAVGLLTARAISVATRPPVEVMAAAAEGSFDVGPLEMVPQQTALRGAANDPARITEQDVDPSAVTTGWNETAGVKLQNASAGVNDEAAASVTPGLFGLSAPSSGGRTGHTRAAAAGRRARSAPHRGGSPDGIFGLKPDARAKQPRSVAYVCDASGSMLERFDYLRRQIGRSVGGLKPVQSFNVIFFQDGAAAAANGRGLLRASPQNKAGADRFLSDFAPSGVTDPIPALRLALAQRPDLIWLLTDGDFPDNAAVVEFIRRENATRGVRINTIAFVNRGDEYERVLRQIASENHGTFQYVGEQDLERLGKVR